MKFDLTIRYLARVELARPPHVGSGELSLLAGIFGSELVPAPATQIHLGGRAFSGLAFATPDHRFSVVVAGPSLEVAYAGLGDDGGLELSDFSGLSQAALGALLADGPLASRVACVVSGLLAEMTPDEMDATARHLLKFPKLFSPAPWEWDWRCVTTVQRPLASRTIETNTLATLKRQAGQFGNQRLDRIRVDLDVNTPQNRPPRFSAEDIGSFYSCAPNWISELGRTLQTDLGLPK